MIAENVTKSEVSEAIVAVHKLKTSKQINDNIADILFRCLSVITDLQEFGEEKKTFEPVKYPEGKEPDCNLCGDYERCAFDREHCTGFIPGAEAVNSVVKRAVKVPTIKMVPKEGAHVLPVSGSLADDYLSGRVKPLV
jgi:hypothetical protein